MPLATKHILKKFTAKFPSLSRRIDGQILTFLSIYMLCNWNLYVRRDDKVGNEWRPGHVGARNFCHICSSSLFDQHETVNIFFQLAVYAQRNRRRCCDDKRPTVPVSCEAGVLIFSAALQFKGWVDIPWRSAMSNCRFYALHGAVSLFPTNFLTTSKNHRSQMIFR